jgi:hypothetical protein
MTNTTAISSGEGTKAPVADRQWINEAGEQVENPELATGFRYVDLASRRAFVWQTKGIAGAAITMAAIFGGLTKAGNIRSTLVNGPKGDPRADVIQGISDWFDELDNGVWSADRVGGGIRVNPEILARAIANVKNERHDGAHTVYMDKITSKLKVQDPGKKAGMEILYSTFAMRNKAVEAEYNRLLPAHEAAPQVTDL